MSTAKTTWEDLARLGWTKRNVFLNLNARRGGTMSNESHLHLNNPFTEQYGWYCYNVVKGQASLAGSRPISASETIVSHTWDNTQNSKPQSEKWEEKVTRTSTTSLTTTTSASIELQQSITIANVASSGYTLTVSTESQKENSYSETEEVTRTFEIEVGPYEKLELLRTKTETGEVATYRVPYGLSGYIGTQGEKYNGHYYWGYGVVSALNDPSGNIELMGTARRTDYTFTMRRTGGKGSTASIARFISPVDEQYSAQLEIEDGETEGPNDQSDNGSVLAGF